MEDGFFQEIVYFISVSSFPIQAGLKLMLMNLDSISPLTYTMKTQAINGVPYLINEKGEVFLYSSVPPISLGHYTKETNTLKLHEGWEDSATDWVKHYRKGLKENTIIALQKATELQKAT